MNNDDNIINMNWLQTNFPEIDNLSHMGRGGQKLVFSGNHTGEGDIVLKIFFPGVDEERVVREIKAPNEISSSRVPRMFSSGKVRADIGDVVWVREQRILGMNLRQFLRQSGPLNNEAVINLALHVLEVLAAAENAHIVHRDVKPDNIIVGEDNNFYLIDFGLARHLNMDSLTATALAYGVGTPGYAPPEQYRNVKDDIDARADLFGLGVTLYECIEGINPFREGARDKLEIFRRIESQSLPAISRQIDDAGEFRQVLHSMTRTRHNHRISTAGEALTWVQEIYSSNIK